MLIFVVIFVQKLKMPILKNNKYKSSQKTGSIPAK